MTRPDHIANTGPGRLYRGQTAVDFYGHRRIGLVVAIIVVVVTVVSLFAQGLNLGLDFEGGQAWDVPASETFGVDEAEQVLRGNDVSVSGSKIQLREAEALSFVAVQIEVVPTAQAEQITADFAAAADVSVEEISFAFTSSSWGEDITQKAIRALVIFLVVVAIFISIRFEWRMALGAIAAMVHDVLISVGIYSILQFIVTPPTVIAFLTILGYSLYDTIVVFDRVKENEARYAAQKPPYEDIINVSMNQVLMRSLNTSFSSIVPVVSLLLIGAGVLGQATLAEFALALFIGMVTGAYSSIFVASPLLGILKGNDSAWDSRNIPRAVGEALRDMVMGGNVGSRRTRTVAAESRRADTADLAGPDRPAGPIAAATATEAQKALSHPPRPRKKKRR
jgi:preprotein translocase subunit SecF